MILRLRDFLLGFKKLRLEGAPVVVHASLSSLGNVEGGADTVVKGLVTAFTSVLVPTFTYKTMVIPRSGPPDNGLIYGSGRDQNRLAEFFTPGLPADPLVGIIPETLRRLPAAHRSTHPILSFAGMNAHKYLDAQSMLAPLNPLIALAETDGWILLVGVDHTVNTAIHAAEALAGRKSFLRWSLTPRGVVECPGFPGCSAGFGLLDSEMDRYTRREKIGAAWVWALPMKMLFKVVISRINQDPLAFLCESPACDRCGTIRLLEKEVGIV